MRRRLCVATMNDPILAQPRSTRFAHALLDACRILPAGLAWRLGKGLGDLVGRLPLRDVKRTREHLAIAFPESSANDLDRQVRQVWQHFGASALWTLATATGDPARLRRHIAIEGAENLKAAAAASRRGEGTVVYTGHFGNWEVMGRVSGALVPLSVIGRRLRHPAVDAVVHRLRTSGGAQVIYQDTDIRDIIRELRRGRIVATLADQDIPHLAGVFVPWFGRLAFTPSAPAGLAQVARCPVMPVFLLRRAGRWVLHVGPRTAFPKPANREAGILAITAWATAYQEALVRRHPGQWAWWHKRWRTRPPEETTVSG